MPRKRKRRCCEFNKDIIIYKPAGIPMRCLELEYIYHDEFESMRLCDVENLSQEEAGERMGISRGTVQRLLYNGRKKLIKSLLDNKGIIIIDFNKKEEINESMFSSES